MDAPVAETNVSGQNTFDTCIKVQQNDVVIVKLKISKISHTIDKCNPKSYSLNVSFGEKSVEGVKGLETSKSESLCWNEELIFHAAINPKKGIDELTFSVMLIEEEGSVQYKNTSCTLKDILGSATIDLTSESGKTIKVLLSRIEIDYDPEKDVRMRPLKCLSADENNFCQKRREIIHEKLEKLKFTGIKESKNIPNIAVIGSGGGMRAVVGMCGAMTALKDLGILDCAMYTAGVSGSAWYITTLYDKLGVDPKRTKDFIKKSLKNVNPHLTNNLTSMFHAVLKQCNYKTLGKYPTLTDAYGGAVSDILLGENWNSKWSDQRAILNTAEVPLPLLAALHHRDKTDINDWVEISPYEVYMPWCGSGIDMKHFGSVFDRGFVKEKKVERPVYFLQGICGSAYANVLDIGDKPGDEEDVTSIDKTDQASHEEFALKDLWGIVEKGVKLTAKGFDFIGTGKVPNWLHGIASQEDDKTLSNRKDSSKDKYTMSLSDSVEEINSPYPLVLHPGRDVDLILSFEFTSEYSKFPFSQLMRAEKWAKQNSIPFPELHLGRIDPQTAPLQEVYVFEGTTAPRKTPTIMHFVMTNKDFRKNSAPGVSRLTQKEKDFADFEAFDEYKTEKFQYSGREFDRLSKLMEFNVMNQKNRINDCIQIAIDNRNDNAQ